MRVTTSQQYDRPSLMMSALTKQADAWQTQVATGKSIQAPSDNAAGWQQLSGLKRAAADDSAYGANIKMAQSLLATTDSALASVETQLQRAKTIAVQGATDTMTPEGRAALRTDLEEIIADLLGLANSKDPRGHPIFGGTGDAAYARQDDGSIAYIGSGESAPIPVGENVSVAATESGPRAFGGIQTTDGETDMFAILSALSSALQQGDGEGMAAAMTDIDAALDQVGATRASVGARAFRMDLEAERLTDTSVTREAAQLDIEGADTATAITELQKTLTILQATQASFTKLTSLSLFDYLR